MGTYKYGKDNTMACSDELLSQKSKLQQEILALESSLGNGRNIADLLSSDTDSTEDSEDSGHEGEDGANKNLEAERQQIQREIEELERTLGADAALVDALTDSEHGSLMDSNGEDSDEDLDLPQDLETCLQMNLVYQEVLKEKLADLERLLNENREQQKDLEEQLSGPSSSSAGVPHHRLFLGNFMKPYFKDKLTALGPPANEETKERLANGTKSCDERKIRRWEPWQKTLLIKSVVTDTMKRMLQPKLSKMEYLTTKMSKAKDAVKQEIQNQITLLEQDITDIRSLREDQLYGARHDYHDWDKIANTDFECFRQADDLMRFWQNYLHPSINKSTWSQDEIAKLADVAEQHMYCHWEHISESLGTNRTAFMCFQTYQRYISKRFRKREWNKKEDQLLRELVDKMRIGNFIPYTQISYFMEGRDNSQLIYRWTCVLDPSLKKGPWTKEEDELLLKAVKKYGCKEWWKIKLEVPGRTDNACRDRYLDCLRADVKRGAWSDDEVELLKKLVEKYGVGKWSKIAAEIPNRVDSQCLNKWKWMQKVTIKGVKRGRGRSVKREPEKKRRCMRNVQKVSGDEEELVTYMDSDGEQPVENVCPVEDCRLEYVQPDMKKWIPARGNKLAHLSEKVKTTLVRLPTEAEESGTNCVRNTVLDKLGNPVKTYVGMEPPALQNPNLSNEHTVIMVSECDVKCLLICMKASVIKAKSSKIKTRLASCTNQNITKNEQKEEKSKTESGQRRRKAVATTRMSYDLMLAITPWVGNVIMHLPFSRKRTCEADIVQKRAADVLLLKSPMFLLFLQALKVDADGCKKVIESRKGKVFSMAGSGSGPYSDVAKRNNNKKLSSPLLFPETLYPQMLPQSAKIAIPRFPQQQRKTKQASKKAIKSASQKETQSASQKETQSASQKETQSASQKETQSASQKETQSASQKETQSASQKETQSASQKETQSASQRAVKSASEKAVKSASEKAVKSASQKAVKSASEKAVKSASEKAVKSASEKAVKSASEKAVKSASEKAVKSASEKAVKSASEKAVKSASEKAVKSASEKAVKSASEKAVKSASEKAVKSASQKAVKSASQKAVKSASQKAVKSASQKAVKSASEKAVKSASQSALIFPQTFVVTQPNTDNKDGTSNIVSTRDPSKLPQPVLHLVVPVESERVTQPASCPTTPGSTVDPPAETVEEVRASKRKPKPTVKAQALLDNRKSKLSKKQAAKIQQNSSVTQTVTVLPQTTAWILTPAGLVPVAEIQIQSPGIPANQKPAKSNNVQMLFQQSVIVNQSAAPNNDTRPNNSAPDLPGNNIKSLPAGSNLGQNHTPSHVLDNTTSIISAPVKNVPQVLPDTNVPSSITGSVTQDPPSKGNQNKTPINPMSSLVHGSSTPVGTSQKIAPSCRDATNNVSKDSVSAVTSTPSKSPVHLLNNFGPGTIPGPQSQTLPHIVPQVLYQQPTIVNQNGSLALINTAGPCIPNNPLTIAANTKATNINKSPPTSSTNSAAKSLNFCLIPASAQSSVLNEASLSISQSSFGNSPVRVSVGSLPTDPPISPRTTSCQIGPQIIVQQMSPEGKRQTVCKAAITSNSRPQQVTFDPSLMFFEQPVQVKNWLMGNGGITLPGLKENMPYLPPFVSSINTLTTLLKGRDSLLTSAVQLLPEEHRESSEEEAKITAVRKMVSEKFKNNKAYMLLKARFLSCFTLPALLATINPVTESADDLAQEDNKDKVKPAQFGEADQLEPFESLFNIKESELT